MMHCGESGWIVDSVIHHHQPLATRPGRVVLGSHFRERSGLEPAWRVWGRAATDLALTIPTQQLEAHINRVPNHLVPLLNTALAAAGALLAIVGGTNLTMLIVGLCIAIVAGAMAVIGANIATVGWWKLVVAGPCIVIAVIVAAGIGVEAWYLGILLVFLACVLTGTGLLLGVLRLTNRRTPNLPT